MSALKVDNDVNAAATAELDWGALSGTDVGLYINLGTGTGAALIVGGRVIPGMHGAAGEIGYLLREPGEPGYAHGHAPLEEYTSGSGLAARGTTLLRRSVTAVDLASSRRRARRRQPPGRRGRDDRDDGRQPGDVPRSRTRRRRRRHGDGVPARHRDAPSLAPCPFRLRWRPGRFLDDAPLIGAIALAVEAL